MPCHHMAAMAVNGLSRCVCMHHFLGPHDTLLCDRLNYDSSSTYFKKFPTYCAHLFFSGHHRLLLQCIHTLPNSTIILVCIYYRAHQKYDISDPGVNFSNPIFAANFDNEYPLEQEQPPSPSPSPPLHQQQNYFELDEYKDTIQEEFFKTNNFITVWLTVHLLVAVIQCNSLLTYAICYFGHLVYIIYLISMVDCILSVTRFATYYHIVRPSGLCVYIRQSTSACGISTMYHIAHAG